ncbi:MAG: phenylacetate--CoA ligase family protein, partial [Hyphomicrobiaceae bacterium]
EERLSQETFEANVSRIVRWAATRYVFYQEWFHDLGVRVDDIRGQAELALIPPVVKQINLDDQVRAPPFGRLVPGDLRDRIRYVLRTSGTTGMPTMMFWTAHDWLLAVELLARNLWAAGLRPGMGLLHLWPTGASQIATLWVRDAAERCAAVPIIEGGRDFQADPAKCARFLCELAKGLELGAITSFPISEALGREIAALGGQSPLRFLLLGGQPTTPEMRARLKRWHPHAQVFDIWASTEAQTLGQCTAGRYHMQEDLVVHQVVDGHHKPAAAGSKGELVMTSLIQYTQPLIRFATGDVIVNTVEDGPCACGRHQRVFVHPVLGRITDKFVAGGKAFLVSDVQSALSAAGMMGKFQITARKDQLGERLELRVESDPGPKEEDLAAALQAELGVPVQVSITPPGSIPMTTSVKYSQIRWI